MTGPIPSATAVPWNAATGCRRSAGSTTLRGSADVLHDASLTLVGDDVRDGPDAVLSSIWITSPCTWTLDTGIGIGSTRDEVLSAYPDAQLESDTADGVAVDRSWEQFYYRAGDLYLRIIVTDGEVSSIDLGGLNEYHFPDEEEPAPADPYTFAPYDKAGSYGIQEWIGYAAIEKINGSFYNVMGLPIQKVYVELEKFLQ